MRYRRRHLIAWIATLALLLGAVAPSIARAMALQADRAIAVDICGSITTLPDGAAFDPADVDAPTGGLTAPNCPYCLLHGMAAVPPAAPRTMAPAAAPGLPRPQSFAEAPRPPRAWGAARPRAPPAQG
jgi:hypothetical protein